MMKLRRSIVFLPMEGEHFGHAVFLSEAHTVEAHVAR